MAIIEPKQSILQTECEDWIHTAQILMSQLTGDSIEELFPARASSTLTKATTPSVLQDRVAFNDQEKLESTTTLQEEERVGAMCWLGHGACWSGHGACLLDRAIM